MVNFTTAKSIPNKTGIDLLVAAAELKESSHLQRTVSAVQHSSMSKQSHSLQSLRNHYDPNIQPPRMNTIFASRVTNEYPSHHIEKIFVKTALFYCEQHSTFFSKGNVTIKNLANGSQHFYKGVHFDQQFRFIPCAIKFLECTWIDGTKVIWRNIVIDKDGNINEGSEGDKVTVFPNGNFEEWQGVRLNRDGSIQDGSIGFRVVGQHSIFHSRTYI